VTADLDYCVSYGAYAHVKVYKLMWNVNLTVHESSCNVFYVTQVYELNP
jgi:hypothetical protein